MLTLCVIPFARKVVLPSLVVGILCNYVDKRAA